MTVDVEEYFQVQALESCYPREGWDTCESRVEKNTNAVLDLFQRHGQKATFFTLAWIAERHNALIGRIIQEGHELACHGYAHFRADRQTPEDFRSDIRKSKQILEDIGGQEVKGYRAATFSIGARNLWAFEILAEEGYTYSSSINPVRHDHYGMPGAPRHPFKPIPDQDFEEYPIPTLPVLGQNFPCGGGGYFRLLPYKLFDHAIKRFNREDRPFMFYFHPWEIDPGQPRPASVPLKSRFRHYTNLGKMENKLERLLKDFTWDRVDRVFSSRKTEP